MRLRTLKMLKQSLHAHLETSGHWLAKGDEPPTGGNCHQPQPVLKMAQLQQDPADLHRTTSPLMIPNTMLIVCGQTLLTILGNLLLFCCVVVFFIAVMDGKNNRRGEQSQGMAEVRPYINSSYHTTPHKLCRFKLQGVHSMRCFA